MKRRLVLPLAVIAAAVVWLTDGGPPDRAAALVPADAVLYVHTTEDARGFAERFGVLGPFAERLDEPWLGEEAAFALLPEGELILLSADDEDAAREYAAREGGELRDGFVVIGEGAGGPALADAAAYEEAVGDLRGDRDAHLWLRGDGGLPLPFADRDVVADLVLDDGRAEIHARRLGGAGEGDFEPRLLGAAPADAFGYIGVRGLRVFGALLPAEASAAVPPELVATLGPLLDELDGEVALTAAPAGDDSAITLVARPDDPAAAREALAGAQGAVAAALVGSESATGQVPVFVERDLGGGLDGYALTLAGGGELVYAVADDRIAVSTSDDGVRAALQPGDPLPDAAVFEEAMPEVPETGQALAFVAAEQLLELADAAGLDASATYRVVRPDLARIRALGAVVRRQGDDTTVELNLLFP